MTTAALSPIVRPPIYNPSYPSTLVSKSGIAIPAPLEIITPTQYLSQAKKEFVNHNFDLWPRHIVIGYPEVNGKTFMVYGHMTSKPRESTLYINPQSVNPLYPFYLVLYYKLPKPRLYRVNLSDFHYSQKSTLFMQGLWQNGNFEMIEIDNDMEKLRIYGDPNVTIIDIT